MKIFSSLLLFGAVSSTGVLAQTLDFSFVRQDQTSAWQSVAVDPVTGRFYQRIALGEDGQDVTVYENRAAFEAGTSSLPSVLLEAPGYFGTYATASGGKLFGRTDTVNTSAARFDLGTGAIDRTISSFPNMTGVNELGTFNWGGYTGVNFLQDASGIYVLGKDEDPGGQTWQLHKVDTDLNVLETKTFVAEFTPGSPPDTLGFATFINGVLYMGNSYNGAGFDHAFDFGTGQYYDIDFDFTNIGDPRYIDNLLYSPDDDTLYLHNHDTFSFYKVGNVSAALNNPVQPVPEGGSYAAALVLLCAAHRFISLRSAKS